MEYKKTLNMTKSGFPMRAGLPKREPEMLKHWEELDLYHELLKKNEGKPRFALHDGPPFSNGALHMGHALNKSIKDFITRSYAMRGYYTPYIPGWGIDRMKSMVRSTSARQEPEKMSTTMKVLIGVVFVALVAALVLRSTVWKDNVVAGAWMMVLVGAVCGLMYYVRKRYPGKRKVGGTMDTVISALLILFCVVYVGMGAMALVAMNK